MTDAQARKAAKEFAAYWKDKGYEKGESQPFWLSLLRSVLGVEEPEKFIRFEDRVQLDNTSFIDGMIDATHVMIEQKSKKEDLMKPIRQSDGTLLNPFRQAKRYSDNLPYSKRPRWIVTCNFQTFHIYDMERPGGDPEVIELADLEKEYYRLSFLTDTGNEHLKKEMEVSIAAGEIVGLLYDAFAKQYADPESERAMKSLNVLCVRLVFCLYAEDAGIFGHHGMFHDYLERYEARDMRRALSDLFKILDTKPEERDPYLKEDNPELAAFPYVNGGLFADEDIEIPPFTDEIRTLLLDKASADFDWSAISPTIFGAVFESTLNPETRRSGGMHYTSLENIHKVIDPLFLDDLNKEFDEISEIAVEKTKTRRLEAFQEKLASLTFLDPAAGSGNFLTETYLSLRRLENKVLLELAGGQISFGMVSDSIKVSINQFYGIEINDFAVTVAKSALWIAESQMMKETEQVVHMNLDFLPLKTNAHIVEGNALRLNWEDVCPKGKLKFIMGNPPFSGTKMMSSSQKNDTKSVLGRYKSYGTLDYVSCWYKKANDYIKGTKIRCAFVSTNSICQGEQVSALWKPLFAEGLVINFAYRTFIWDSEASVKAHVHCIIVGFSQIISEVNYIIDSNGLTREVPHINAYLVSADDIFIESRRKPICNVQEMFLGCDFKDDNKYIFSEEEKNEFIKKEPRAEKYFKKYINAKELINRKHRYCLWLNEADPHEIQKMPLVMETVRKVKEFRERSNSGDTRRYAELPTRPARLRYYSEMRNTVALGLPRISSQTRRYLPMEMFDENTIGGASILMIPEATLYTFAILSSNVHMAWMRAVCGRMKSDYRYANGIVYNTFCWPNPSDSQKQKIEQTAKAILDARSLYPECNLADMYGEDMYLYPELLKAHQQNDIAVMAAYGWKKGDAAFSSEAACVAELMKLYQKMTEKEGK